MWMAAALALLHHTVPMSGTDHQVHKLSHVMIHAGRGLDYLTGNPNFQNLVS